jgi:hypothetical protein
LSSHAKGRDSADDNLPPTTLIGAEVEQGSRRQPRWIRTADELALCQRP